MIFKDVYHFLEIRQILTAGLVYG
ncbi:MAG: hypothetical protein BAJATHORv1_10453 [Candidatus Thorarchaeota archaeon]|nr:MAG: hypothetical protein BAJATHORv1_10453 [Candidatus Thorarchaeota archaeon]